MKVYQALNSATWRANFRRSLVAKGFTQTQANAIGKKIGVYLVRLKENMNDIRELAATTTREEMWNILDSIFTTRWKGHLNPDYAVIPDFIKQYVDFMLSAEAYYGEILSEADGEILNDLKNKGLPQQLTVYETDYMKDGKLTFLANPQLLCMIHEGQAAHLNPAQMGIRCHSFYRNVLPEMTPADYVKLLKKWKGVGRGNMFELLFPDGSIIEAKGQEAVYEVIRFYGAQEVRKKRFQAPSGQPLVESSPVALSNRMIDGLYIAECREHLACHRLINMINMTFGKKITINVFEKE